MRLLIVMVLVSLAGCGSISAVGYPTGDGTYMVMRTMTDPHSMSATIQRNWMEVCTTKTHNDYINCVMVPDSQQFVSQQGYIATIAGPVMYSAAAAYGLHQVGKGIGKSGSVTNNSNTNDVKASAQNKSNTLNANESFNDSRYQWK